jgi:hypothetical protein
LPALSAISPMISGLSPAAWANGVSATVRSGTAVCQGSANRTRTVIRIAAVTAAAGVVTSPSASLARAANQASAPT